MGFAMKVDKNNPSVRLRTSPAWLPESYRDRPERLRLKWRPTLGERRVLRKQKKIDPSAWAPKHRTITYGPLEGARWDNEFMPHMAGIMDASFYPSVREIGNVKTPQGASSAGLETMLGYAADMRPGPALIIFPDRDTAKKRCTDYMQPMFKLSPRLARLLTGIDDDMAGLRVKLRTMLIYMGWAGSPTSMSNVSIMYLVVDEVDKMARTAGGKEGALRDYIRQRVNAFPYTHKIWWSSTPTDLNNHITRYMDDEAQVTFDYHVACPDCGVRQPMVFDQIMKSFPRELTDPKEMERDKCAGYLCPHCGSVWDDRKRDRAVIAAMHDGWRARDDGRELFEYLKAVNPEKICFHSPAWISPLIPLWKSAAAWLRGRLDRDAMKIFVTQYKAEGFKDYATERKEDRILALRDERPEGLVPGNGLVAALVAGVDTQDDGFYYEIRAMGWGMDQESWQIKAGFVLTFEALEQILFKHEYRDAAGVLYPVHLAVQDSLGHRTADVYDFSRLWPGRLIPYKGQQRKQTPVTWSRIDTYPGTNRAIPGGVLLLNGDATFFKNDLAKKLGINASDPGAWHLHSATTDEYAAHMCAEYRDDDGLWQCPKGKPNHLWDCAYLSLVAAHILNIKTWARPEPVRAKKKASTEKPAENPFTGGQQIVF